MGALPLPWAMLGEVNFPNIHTDTQLGVIYNLTEGAPHPITPILGKGVKQDWKGLVLSAWE